MFGLWKSQLDTKNLFVKWKSWELRSGNIGMENLTNLQQYNESILIPRLERVLGEKDWEKVVTHNQGGEYGHYRHIGTHNVMSRLCPEKLWVFDTCNKTPLDYDIKEQKGKILSECYKSQKQVTRWFKWDCEKISKYE